MPKNILLGLPYVHPALAAVLRLWLDDVEAGRFKNAFPVEEGELTTRIRAIFLHCQATEWFLDYDILVLQKHFREAFINLRVITWFGSKKTADGKVLGNLVTIDLHELRRELARFVIPSGGA